MANNSLQIQRQKIYDYLKRYGNATTLELRQELDIMHPAGRIKELREAGINIKTTWVYDYSTAGEAHKVGNYILSK